MSAGLEFVIGASFPFHQISGKPGLLDGIRRSKRGKAQDEILTDVWYVAHSF
jgi:hypothetical protein